MHGRRQPLPPAPASALPRRWWECFVDGALPAARDAAVFTVRLRDEPAVVSANLNLLGLRGLLAEDGRLLVTGLQH